MQKAGRGWWLGICLWALVVGSTCPSGAYAATCVVGDESQGHWVQLPASDPDQGKCLFPGPPAADSPWPLNDPEVAAGNQTPSAWRIEGKYKINVGRVLQTIASTTIPPARAVCITGYVEAYLKAITSNRLLRGAYYPGDGSLVIYNGLWPGEIRYERYYEPGANIHKWVWTNKDCEKEEPPPAPTSTPNPDPGKPDCPQLPL